MKILYINYAKSADDRTAWSGTVYKAFNALKASGAEVDYLSCSVAWTLKERIIRKFFNFLFFCGCKKLYLSWDTFLRRNLVKGFLKKQEYDSYDFVFVTAYSIIASALHQALLEIGAYNVRYVFLADATFSGVENYYPQFSNLWKKSSREANAISKDAFEGAYKVIVSSDWAKTHAVMDYGIEKSKIEVIEFGANLDYELLGTFSRSYSSRPLNFLLSGVSWLRKGGDIAIECMLELKRRGYDVSLHIVGMNIPSKYKHLNFIVSHGFLNKNDPKQYRDYLNILERSDILLFPSRAECSAIVLCEAAGLGLPVFCYETGGLANYVYNGVNGYRIPLNCSGREYADKIEECIMHERLFALHEGALQIYNDLLNWNSWTERVMKKVLI